MLKELSEKLESRGVRISVQGNFPTSDGSMKYTAHVSNHYRSTRATGLSFEFRVTAKNEGDIAAEVEKILPMYEPVISFLEKEMATVVENEPDTSVDRYAALVRDVKITPGEARILSINAKTLAS